MKVSFRMITQLFCIYCLSLASPKSISNAYRHNDAFYDPLSRGTSPRKTALKTCLIALSCYSFSCLQVVTSGDECLVERFGKYHRKLGPGWHFVFKPFEVVSFRATTREQVLDVPPQQCYTLDNAPIRADAVVFMRINHIEMAKYQVEDVMGAILNLCLTQLREEVGKLTLDESFSSRERINKELLKDLNAVTATWGVTITRVELQNMEPSKDILAAMELQMAAERKKRAAILRSEGERSTLINEAEGKAAAAVADAEAQRKTVLLRAQAEAERQKIEAEGLRNAISVVAKTLHDAYGPEHEGGKKESVEGAVQFLSLIRYLETQSKFAASENSKVLMLPSKSSLPMTYGGLKFLLDDD
jgi:regulator of protease activity HflC (stomatin/prohibitin superfamily)